MNRFISAYNRASAQTVCDVYKKPSVAKKTIERIILKEMKDCGGWGYKVIYHTCQYFTAGYLYPNRYTGEIVLRVHKPHYTIDLEWHSTSVKVV